jgi:HAD superfamily hydrolase (TIGR01509 family)
MAEMRGVIFDCDGVLVDSEPTSNRVLASVLSEIGVPLTPEQSAATFKGRAWTQCLGIIEDLLGEPPPADLTDRYRARRDEALARVKPVRGIVAALERIDLPDCVASSGDHGKMRVTLKAAGLYDRFRGRIFSALDVGGIGKPAPDLFLHAAARMRFDPLKTTVVEDSVPGVEAGVAAGMRVLAYAHDGEAEALAAAGGEVFTAMTQLPGLLARSSP